MILNQIRFSEDNNLELWSSPPELLKINRLILASQLYKPSAGCKWEEGGPRVDSTASEPLETL